MRKTELTDTALCAAVLEMTEGLIDAELGGGVVKNASVCLAVANAAVLAH